MYKFSENYSKSKFDFYRRQKDYCPSCGKHNLGLDAKYFHSPEGIKKSCSSCHEGYKIRVQNGYLVSIFLVEDLYIQFWGATYGFKTLEDVKSWIDSGKVIIGGTFNL